MNKANWDIAHPSIYDEYATHYTPDAIVKAIDSGVFGRGTENIKEVLGYPNITEHTCITCALVDRWLRYRLVPTQKPVCAVEIRRHVEAIFDVSSGEVPDLPSQGHFRSRYVGKPHLALVLHSMGYEVKYTLDAFFHVECILDPGTFEWDSRGREGGTRDFRERFFWVDCVEEEALHSLRKACKNLPVKQLCTFGPPPQHLSWDRPDHRVRYLL